MSIYEERRLTLQAELDSQKTQLERNRLGQFATPTLLAREVVDYGLRLLPKELPIRFLDPAIGTGAFYAALRDTIIQNPVESVQGFEVDPHYGVPAQQLWADTPLKLNLADFTRAKTPVTPSEKFNFIICNPPYVRHHHLTREDKLRLRQAAKQAGGIHLSGLAGLYCYFLAMTHHWMSEGAVAGWLIPSEFMDVNYGSAIKQYLLDKVTLLHIHRFEPKDVQFADALVSSTVVWFRNCQPSVNHKVTFTYGGTLTSPQITREIGTEVLRNETKWTRFPASGSPSATATLTLSDLFTIKRGLATGDNKFFILTKQQIQEHNLPTEFLRPILPSPRHLADNEILSDNEGIPIVSPQLFLLDCRLPETEVASRFPTLWRYLESGKPAVAERYLCSHRNPWYAQEERPPAPIVCTYISRNDGRSGRPFRFILNHSCATAPNVYLMLYPKPILESAVAQNSALLHSVWQMLSAIDLCQLIENGRVYGGSLHKLEPKELGNIAADQFTSLLPNIGRLVSRQLGLFETVL